MRTSCFGYGLPGLAAAEESRARKALLTRRLNIGWQLVLRFAGLAVLLTGCATHQAAGLRSSGTAGFAQPQASRFGTVALGEKSGPASFSFQKAKGRLGSVKVAVVDSAELGLSGPGAGVIVAGAILSGESGCDETGGDPRFYAVVAGAAGGVAAVGAALAGPVVGAEGLIRSLRKVSPAELAEREAALRDSLSQMAAQEPFRGALLEAGAHRIRGGFLSHELKGSRAGTAADGADAIFEARVDDLRLERAGSSEDSYVLHIKTHARMVRVTDGAVCFESHAEYQSAKALFLDWTMHGSIEGVAETGYRALAEHYVDQLLGLKPRAEL